MICWMVFLKSFIDFDPRMGTRSDVFWHPFSILFRPCSARVPLKVPWLVLASLLAPFWLLWVSFWLHFGIEDLPNRESKRERARERERDYDREKYILQPYLSTHSFLRPGTSDGRPQAASMRLYFYKLQPPEYMHFGFRSRSYP